MSHNVSICVRAGLPKPRGVPDNERTKDTKTLDYASTPLDANTVLVAVSLSVNSFVDQSPLFIPFFTRPFFVGVIESFFVVVAFPFLLSRFVIFN